MSMTTRLFLNQNIISTHVLATFCLIAFCTAGCQKAPSPNTLASVDQNIVSVEKFRGRYGKLLKMASIRDNLLARQKLLAGLITEEVLLVHAEKLGFFKDAEFYKNKEAATRQALLDAYAEHVVASRVDVTEADVRAAFVKLKTQIKARHLYAQSLEEANALHKRLQNDEAFEKLATEIFNDPELSESGGDLGYFTLGDMDVAFEDAAYNLPVGEISQPVKTAYGYSIIQVTDRIRNPFITEYEFQQKKGKIRAYLQMVETRKQITAFTHETAAGLDIEIRKSAFRYLCNRLFQNSEELKESTQELPALDDAKMRSEILLSFGENHWTIDKFFDKSDFTSLRQKKRITNEKRLAAFIKGIVVREHLLAQAKKLGLHNKEAVLAEIDREMRGFVLKRMRDKIDREVRASVKVPEEAVREHYEKFSDQYYFPEEANVAEILVATEAEGREIVELLRQGANFSDLAKKHSLREWAKANGGALGFAPRGKLGALADTIFATPVGNVIGPLQIDRYYSVIKILGKKERQPKSYQEAQKQIEQDLFWKWHKQGVHDYLENLRRQVEIYSDDRKLRELKISEETS